MVLSPAAVTVLAAILAGAWILARRDAQALHSFDALSAFQLSTRAWFVRAWASSAAILCLPAAAGFGIGWLAHRQRATAASTALVAVAVVSFAMWQAAEKRDAEHVVYKPAETPAPRPAASSLAVASPPAQPEPRPDAVVTKTAAEEAQLTQARIKLDEDAAAAKAAEVAHAANTARAAQAAEAARADQASRRKAGASSRPAAPPIPEPSSTPFSDRTRLVIQTEMSPPTGPGVMPAPPPMPVEKPFAHPSFPGCRWATPTNWVCEPSKP